MNFLISKINYVIKKSYSAHTRYSVSGVNCYRLMYISSGRGTFIFKNEKFTAQKNHLLIFKPGEEYHILTEGDEIWEFFVIAFTSENIMHFTNTPYNITMETADYFIEAERLWNLNAHACTLYVNGAINMILYSIISQEQNGAVSHGFIDKTIRYITENISKKITVADLAENVSYSSSYFNKIFINALGTTPIKYVNKLRIQKACRLLNTNMFSAAEVAEKCGLENMYYFSNTFKKYMGISPREYKKTVTQNEML